VARQPDETLDRLLTRTLQSHAAGDEVCPSAEDVAGYLERSLDSEETRRVELHLSSCARCAETLATLIETEPVASSAPPAAAWWSWRTWRWAVPATTVVVVGIWFASALREERTTTAPQMAQYKEAAPSAQAPAAEETAVPQDLREPSASPQSTSADGAPGPAAKPLQSRQVPAQPGEAKEQSSGERDAAAANAALVRSSPPTGFAPEQPAELAKSEESRTDVPSVNARRERNAGVEGRAIPAAPAPAAAAAAAAPPIAAPAAAEKAADARAQDLAGAIDTPRAATSSVGSAPAPSAPKAAELSQGQGQTQGRASAAFSAFAPLLVRARGGNVMWRISGSVIEQSSNGGAVWTTEFRAANVVSAAGVAADDTVWLVGAGGLVLRRPPTGGWRVVPAPVTDDLVSVSDAAATSVTVRAANGRQYQTRDAGVTWTAR
jgi:hypothetical protein